MKADKAQVDNKYRISFYNDNKKIKATGIILENDAEKQLLKFKTKENTYECAYNTIIKIQPLYRFWLKIFICIALVAEFLLLIINPKIINPKIKCGTYYVGIQPYKETLKCNGMFCRCVQEHACSQCDKPIIYLYPQQTTEVRVELGYPENTLHTYPKYKGAWQVKAEPDGNLTDLATGRHYYALYWEGKNTVSTRNLTEGFIVKGEDTISFLEEKLAQLGLNEREAEEFIVYWLPKLENAPYNYIRFQTQKEQNKNMPLTITPAPQTLIRVMMEYVNLENPIQIKEQKLPAQPQREGFTVVEWGGSKIEM